MDKNVIKQVFEDMEVGVEITTSEDKLECGFCNEVRIGVTIWIEELLDGVKRISKFFMCNNCLKRGNSLIAKPDVMFS